MAARGASPLYSPAERRILAAAASGQVADLSAGAGPAREPGGGEVQADFLVRLALGLLGEGRVHPRGVRVARAHVRGELNLDGARLPGPLALTGCLFERPPSLVNARTQALDFSGSELPGFHCANSVLEEGDLILAGVTFTGPLVALKSTLGGDLMLAGCTARAGPAVAMAIRSCTIHRNLVLDDAQVRGSIDLRGSTVGMAVTGRGAQLLNPGGITLKADGLQCGGVFLLGMGRRRFASHGTLRLSHARLGSALVLQDGALLEPGGRALLAAGIHVEGDVAIRRELVAHGELHLQGARIGGELLIQGAALLNPRGPCLGLEHIQVAGSIYLGGSGPGNGLRALGPVTLASARIQGELCCVNGGYAAGKPAPEPALDLHGAHVGQTFRWTGNRVASGDLDWAGLEVASLEDELNPGNYPPGRYALLGCVYRGLAAGAHLGVADRLHWIRNSVGPALSGSPQPYEQLGQFYRSVGRYEDAKTVGIERRRFLARCSGQGLARRLLDAFLDTSVRFGYETWRVAYGALFVWALGSGLFYAGNRLGLLVPSPTSPKGVPIQWIPFNPLAYSADVLVPGLDLQQKTHWHAILPSDHRHGYAVLLNVWIWIQVILGWAFTSLGIAGFTGLIKSD